MSALSNQGTFESAHSFLGAFRGKEQSSKTSFLTLLTSDLTSYIAYLAPHTSHFHFTPHSSHLTLHISRLIPHTSHFTPHTSHSSHHTPRTSRLRPPNLPLETSDVAPHTLQSTSHTSCLTPLISHIRPHISLVRQGAWALVVPGAGANCLNTSSEWLELLS